MLAAISNLWDRLRGKPVVRRSPHWPALRARWLEAHPTCAACGRKTSLEVHHIMPVHIDPTQELVETNLLTLCEPLLGAKHHFHLGHFDNWKTYNPDVVRDAALMLKYKSKENS